MSTVSEVSIESAESEQKSAQMPNNTSNNISNNTFSNTSSQIHNKIRYEYANKADYIKHIKENYTKEHFEKALHSINNLKVFVIGDTIIDQYAFVRIKGRAIKDPILSVEHLFEETYAGGILAIANHIANFASEVRLFTLLGGTNSYEDLLRSLLNKNITMHTFVKENSPTTLKKRYISHTRNNKLFKVEFINDKPISDALCKEILVTLDEHLKWCDLIVVGDFGHGFINDEIRKHLENSGKFLAVNAQSNSANMGYNYFNLYNRTGFMSMNEDELRMPLSRRFENLANVISEAHDKYNLDKFLVTIGKEGCIYCRGGKIFRAPGFTDNVRDTVGAGDAVFAVSALLVYQEVADELIPFFVNCVGGIASNIMGNKESVTKDMILGYLDSLLE